MWAQSQYRTKIRPIRVMKKNNPPSTEPPIEIPLTTEKPAEVQTEIKQDLPKNANNVRVGNFQRIPAEETTVENISKKYTLYAGSIIFPGKANFVSISNRDDSGEEVMHEIWIEGNKAYVRRALVALDQALATLESVENRANSDMKQEMVRASKEGKVAILVPGAISKKDLPEIPLPEYNLTVRRSRYDVQNLFFIIKGSEKEDIAIEPPFKIDVENGDFISVTEENLTALREELQMISNL